MASRGQISPKRRPAPATKGTMHKRCTGWVALAVLLASAPRTEAGCPIALEGEAPVVEQLRRELSSFEDDGTACVAVWVTCHQDGDHIAIDLRDDLRRSTQRSFTSAAGAAAFIVSWTQRPLQARAVVIRPPARGVLAGTADAPTARVTPPSKSPNRWPSQPWHGELSGAYVRASGTVEDYGLLAASLLRRIAWFRLGVSIRLISDDQGLENDEAELTFGASEQLSEHLALRIELAGGRTMWRASTSPTSSWGQNALRGSARVMFTWEATPSLGLEIGGGIDTLRAMLDDAGLLHNLGSGSFRGFAHVDLGMRWAL
jgi:hypothetical protein